MSMWSVVAGAWPLLLGMAVIMLGNGLQGTLLGLRATLEGFGTVVTGFVMAGYSVGFLGGSLLVPRFVRTVGHVRVFAALASLASAAALLHAVFVDPLPWGLFRLLYGFCLAGIFVVAESWLNDRASNETRGGLLSAYMVISIGGMGAGQLLLNLANPLGPELFILVSVLLSLALVPMALSARGQPRIETPEPVSLGRLYATSPLGVVGCLGSGLAYGAFFGMGAVYGRAIGLSVGDVSLFIAIAMAGTVAFQWPIGRLSDRFDRRQVIIWTTFAAAAAALAAIPAAETSRELLFVASFAYGGTSLPLYSLCVAHTNDHLPPPQMVAASATLVLIQGIGMSLGPVIGAAAMAHVAPAGLLLVAAGAHAAIGAFGLYRTVRREPVPLERQREYPPTPPRGSPVVAAVASRSVRDAPDDGRPGP